MTGAPPGSDHGLYTEAAIQFRHPLHNVWTEHKAQENISSNASEFVKRPGGMKGEYEGCQV